MATPRTQATPPDPLTLHAELPAGPRTVLRLKSLVFLPASKTAFMNCLARSGLRAPDGKAWSPRTLNPVLDQLRGQGLLNEELACVPALLHPVAVDAMASAEGGQLAEAVRRAFPVRPGNLYYYSQQIDGEALCRLIRLAVYANDEDGFTTHRDLYDKECAPDRTVDLLALLLAGTPLAPDWLASRHAPIQLALLEAKLTAFLETGVPGPGLMDLVARCRTLEGKPGFAPVRDALQSYDLLAGNLSVVRRGLKRATGGAPDVGQWSLEGALAFLDGRNDEALRHYRDALKQHRKQVGKRKAFLRGPHGLFFLMALLRAGAAVQAEMQNALDAALAVPTAYTGGFAAMQSLLWVVQGLDARARMLTGQLRAAAPAEPLSAACLALAEYALDANLARRHQAALAERFDQLKDGLPLVARIFAEVLAAVVPRPAPYEAFLGETGGGVSVAFTRLVEVRQPWERALDSLDAFLAGGTLKPGAAPAARKAKRLAWFVDPDTQAVEVAEQSAKGRDGWSDGRAVALKRLHERDPRLDYLTEQDAAPLRSIRRETEGWYGEVSYGFDTKRTIPALVGHPTVFDARHRSRPLELVSYPLELVVTEARGGYHIALSHTAEGPDVFLEPETPTRFRVIEFPQRLLPLQEILGRRGLTVPKQGRDRIVELVRRDHPALPVRAEIAALAPDAQEGQAEPVVQLVPQGPGASGGVTAGVALTLVVRPFGAGGPAFIAGLGGRSVLATVGGEQRRVNRDLAAELAQRAALVAACPALRDRLGTDMHEAAIDDAEGALDLLLELQAYPGPVSIEWPEGKKLHVSAVSPDKLKLRVARDKDWFGVSGTVAVDDDQVLDMRFLLDRLDRAQGRFVPLDDGRFVALTRQLQAQLQRLAAVSEPHKDGRRVHALGAPSLQAVLDEAGTVDADAAWTRHVARIRAAEGWTPRVPTTLQAELRDYQVEGFTWLSRLARWGAGACLADDMGLGKTVQAIAVMLDRAAEGPCLVVAPTSVCPNWGAEIARFAPTLTCHRLSAASDRAALVAGLGPRDVLVCSYGLLHGEGELLAGKEWQMAVLDEAQAIKNADSKRAQASLSLQAGFRLALSGTPVENDLDELWSLFNFVNPGLLGSREGFGKRFAVPIERDRDANARQALRGLVRPFLLRRTKAAVLSELPPRTEQTMEVEMGDAERAFYEALRQRALEHIAALDVPEGKRKIHILAEITRLRRACCNPALIDPEAGVPSGKLDAVMELIDDLLRNRHKALVFSQFTGHLHLVREALDARGIRYEYLDGSTPSAERERRVAAFQGGSAELFLISLRAGGTGLNLTAADYVVHLDPWWNPAVEDQASDRAHRIGQERPVTIYRLIMQDSIEERIVELHRGKRDLAADLLDGAETTARLSEEELLGLIRA